MKVLITGGKGMLATDIEKTLDGLGIEYLALGSDKLDITKKAELKSVIEDFTPTHIIHTAGYTAVDKAESNEEQCYKINVEGTKNIVDLSYDRNIAVMYFSTDYVFGSMGTEPLKIDDDKNPKGVYAKSKYDGELQVIELPNFYILRVSWLYGKNGANFVNTMMRLSEDKNEITVVADQIGSPSWTVDVAKTAMEILLSNKYGIYHVANEGYVSWADFARKIFEIGKRAVKVIDTTTEEYGAMAPRPKNSRFDTSKLSEMGFLKLPTWEDALKRYMKEKGWL